MSKSIKLFCILYTSCILIDVASTYTGNTVELLKSFPAVCKLSLKLNTALPASAACERLFSVAGLIFRPRRACIGSKNFENQLLLRLNKAYW